jgi:phenylpyruvate tautomerase PptA (4-oxalocrotonate tautomerase family)
MPKIYLNCPVETFTATAKDDLAAELTTLALEVENLPNTPFVRSTVWIYINEYPAANVYHGGMSSGTRVISLEVNAFEGGLDKRSKQLLIERFTTSVRKHAGIKPGELVPVYIVIREVPELNWGVFGKTMTLADLRNPPADAKAI